MSTTLIFPSSVPRGLDYARSAKHRGERVVAASSFRYDTTAALFETWRYLPSVYDHDFSRRLAEVITEFGITRIFCPVAGAYAVLKRLVREGLLSIEVDGEIAVRPYLDKHQELVSEAAALHAFVQDIAERRSPLSHLEVAAFLRQSLSIFGESDATKMAAMMAVFADAPRGDVVEIGVLVGRTACVLTLLAQRHQTGAVLAVDPWSGPAAAQHDSPRDFQEMAATVTPAMWEESFFESFVVSLLPVAAGRRFNYLAMTSADAHNVWSSQRTIETPHFGKVDYAGAVSVIHIDGNHDYANVFEDCNLWLPHLLPGGWLILDDYLWFHGDGPRRVGDALLTRRHEQIERAFVCGKALFVKFSTSNAGAQALPA